MVSSLFCFVYLLCYGTSCGGTRPAVVATDESIVSSQVSAARLQAVNDGLRELLQVYDRQFANQIGRAVGEIDAALDKLDEYDVFVQELVRRMRALERATRTGERESAEQE